MSDLKIKLSRWMRFFGKRVLSLMAIATFSGVLQFAVELAFAYIIQDFLVVVGVVAASTIQVPRWFPAVGLYPVVGFVILIGFLRGFLGWVQSYMQGIAAEDFRYIQRSRIINWAYDCDSLKFSDVVTMFNEYTERGANGVLLLQASFAYSVLGGCIVLQLFVMDPRLTILIGVFIGVTSFATRATNIAIKGAGDGLAQDAEVINGVFVRAIKNLLLLQILGTQKEEKIRTNQGLERYVGHMESYYRILGFKYVFPQLVGVILLCGVAIFVNSHHSMSPGMLVSYLFLLTRLVQIISQVTVSSTGLTFYWPFITRLFDWWRNQGKESGRKIFQLEVVQEANPPERLIGPIGVSVQDLCFGYPGERAVFDKFDACLQPGSTTVIIGASGAGKSTFLHLVLGLLIPTSGTVKTFLGAAHSEIDVGRDRARFLKSVGYVGPDSFIFQGSILDNILYGLDAEEKARVVSSGALEAALVQTKCDFIQRFAQGLEHELSDQGAGLSAGEKQRLALARAILRKPGLLILDEATANVDHGTEVELVNTLAQFKGTMTIVAVTHRREILRIADTSIELGTL